MTTGPFNALITSCSSFEISYELDSYAVENPANSSSSAAFGA